MTLSGSLTSVAPVSTRVPPETVRPETTMPAPWQGRRHQSEAVKTMTTLHQPNAPTHGPERTLDEIVAERDRLQALLQAALGQVRQLATTVERQSALIRAFQRPRPRQSQAA